MGTASWRRTLRLALLLVTSCGLTSCLSTYERRTVRQLTAAGELHRARNVLARLVASDGEPEDQEHLARLDAELGGLHFQQAREWLERGYPEQAYLELGRCLGYAPPHTAAILLADELWQAHQASQASQEAFRAAVDGERWSAALALLAAPENPYFARSGWGRCVEMFELAWQQLDRRIGGVRGRGDAPAMAAAIAEAEVLLERHPDLAAACSIPIADSLVAWRHRVWAREQGEALWKRAIACQEQGAHRAAYRALQRALILLPGDPELRRSLFLQRDRLTRHLASQLERAAAHGEWKTFLRLDRTLRKLGYEEQRRHAGSPSLEEVRRRGIEELLEESHRFEERGLPGNALLAVTEARELDSDHGDVAMRWQWLRDQVLGRPLVGIEEPGAPRPGVRSFPAVVILRGEARYDEQRAARLRSFIGFLSEQPVQPGNFQCLVDRALPLR